MKDVTRVNVPIFLTVYSRCHKSCECFYFVTFHGHLAVLRRVYLFEDVTVVCIYWKEFVWFDKASVDLYLFKNSVSFSGYVASSNRMNNE
jgi:hypothetical protein